MGDDESEAAPETAERPHDDLPAEVPYPVREGEPSSGLPRRLEAWRRRSAAGAVFTGMAFGLRDVFEAPTDEPAVVLETSGTPPKDLPVEADLDDAPPRQTVVRIRPWLLEEGAEAVPAAPDRERTVAPPRKPRPLRRTRRS